MAGCKKPNGNCTHPSDDGLPVQCVGRWAKEKHDYLNRYIDATKSARALYLRPKGRRPAGGAAYVELFAGPGMARVRDNGEIIPGSPLIALQHQEAPFTRVILCELDDENIAALHARTDTERARTKIIEGDCNAKIGEVIKHVPPYGLNLALVDPYGLRGLAFETLGQLARVRRMDIILHFPLSDMKRNLDRDEEFYDRFLGTRDWRQRVNSARDVPKLVAFLKERLVQFGYVNNEHVYSPPIKNSTNNTLYHLVFISKDKLGNKIWKSITRTTPHGQPSLPGL
jgi:three-Cys-motif partner protein